jgi:hypothetical protein
MPKFLCSALVVGLALAPAAALAQYVIPEPPPLVMVSPAPYRPLGLEDAAQIAMMHGMAVVEDVDVRMWDGNFKVEGKDRTGDDIVMRIDHETGEVLDIDD